ncbi:trace amine-associated receptor 1-like [Anabas testudineus]|uniref:trace amine-associated receptor 1-like n=1 Tax=Anabas testudineus TaxID=64144 RepID=UPI000E457074|nr:trace amine-associated receptor 1-like [Anabas testudineus]
MEPEVAVNWSDFHACFEIDKYTYILANTPSFKCALLYLLITLLSVVTTCGNILVIIPIIYFKQLHTPTNLLVVSLAMTDLLVGVLIFPLSMTFSLSSCLNRRHLFCKIRGSFDITLTTCSILNLCCISVDRYYAVCQPLTYRAKITHRVVVIMIIVSWGVSTLIGITIIITGLNNEECEERCLVDVLMANTIGPMFSFYLPMMILLCIYLKIFLVAQRQARSIHNTTCQSTKSGATVSKLERKATKTLAIVLGIFLLCWTPFFLCATFQPFINNPVPLPVIETLYWLALSNSMLNPFIYAFFYSWFRAAFRMIISGKIFQGDFANIKLH